ncbi:MAG: hypothetical protein DME48_04535, partial [Verrucomicrobia bacterium]
MQLLLDEGGGHARLAQYVSNISHASNDPIADLKVSFPPLREEMERKWQSMVARLSEHQTYQFLTFAESERRLDELLQIKVSGGSRNREPSNPVDLNELARRKLSTDEKS